MIGSKTGSEWNLDEYVVVADFYLRIGHTTDKNDVEMLKLAALTGRTASSISRASETFTATPLAATTA